MTIRSIRTKAEKNEAPRVHIAASKPSTSMCGKTFPGPFTTLEDPNVCKSCERVAKAAANRSTQSAIGTELRVESVYPNQGQPRQVFDEDELDELAASIEATGGLIEPIVVVKRPSLIGEYMIVAGERRWRAHVKSGRKMILAIVKDLTDDQIADLAIIENLQRVDISPMEEARAFKKRVDSLMANGMTHEAAVQELASRWGMKQPWRITERLSLLKLTEENQDALLKGILTPSQATEMSRLQPNNQRILFQAIAAGRCKTYQELRATASALAASENQVVMTKMFGELTTTGQTQTVTITPTSSGPVITAPAQTPQVVAAPAPQQEAPERETVMEREILELEALLSKAFVGNKSIISRKVRASQAAVMADKLEIIGKMCLRLAADLNARATIEQFSLPINPS